MHAQPSVTVRVTRHFPASPARVFDAWLDPKKAGKWLFATPTGKMVRAESNPRVGGTFIYTERRDGEDIEHTGEYEAIVRPERLVFTFCVPKYTKESTRVTIDIVPQIDGCQLTLTHEGVWPDYEERTRTGWSAILEGLASMLQTAALPA